LGWFQPKDSNLAEELQVRETFFIEFWKLRSTVSKVQLLKAKVATVHHLC
jgi:hypothetical protein